MKERLRLTRVDKNNCSRETVSSCRGYPVQTLALWQIKTVGLDKQDTIVKISRNLCPKGNNLQLKERQLKKKQYIW